MISERKYQILKHCNIVASSPKATSDSLGLPHDWTKNVMLRMAGDSLLSHEDGLYMTTPNGRIEVRLFHDAASRVVPSPKIDKFKDTYETPPSYQRNQGHKEIQSRGFPC